MYLKNDYFRSRFYCQSDDQKKRYRLVKWNILCRPIEEGVWEFMIFLRGGIHDLDMKNVSLLGNWLFKLQTTNGVWQQLICNNYLFSKPFSQVM